MADEKDEPRIVEEPAGVEDLLRAMGMSEEQAKAMGPSIGPFLGMLQAAEAKSDAEKAQAEAWRKTADEKLDWLVQAVQTLHENLQFLTARIMGSKVPPKMEVLGRR